MTDAITIGSWAGFWGDSQSAARQVLDGADLDYLVGDHLAEITMALLARARAQDPEAGFVPDVVRALEPLMDDLAARGVKVVTNGGGLNPAACARALQAAAGDRLTVAAVLGDDVSGLPRAGLADMFTGEAVPEHVLTMNAYLGARPIAEALRLGADIVVTGRCADSAVVLGPLLHEFAWDDADHDRLSAGSLIGHLVECGPQGVGGLFTDWEDVPGWDDMGYPIVECRADGTAVLTKPAGTGGLVTPATAAEQLLYEIGDPGAYLLPDVVCDWRDVRLQDDGPERVRVSGARGTAPTTTYKATTTTVDGFRLLTSVLFAGAGAAGRARKAAAAIVARAERVAGTRFPETSIELVGEGTDAVVLKLGAKHPEDGPLKVLAREMMSLALVAQGMTGIMGGRPRPQPVVRLLHLLVPKDAVPVVVEIGGATHPVTVAPGDPDAQIATPEIVGVDARPGERVTVPLLQIAHARSGDKGNHANIGVRARRPELLPVLVDQLTPELVRRVFGDALQGPVRRWALPGVDAVNLLLEDVLGGRGGGTSSLRYDPQGKSYAAQLLAAEVEVPPDLLGDRVADATGGPPPAAD